MTNYETYEENDPPPRYSSHDPNKMIHEGNYSLESNDNNINGYGYSPVNPTFLPQDLQYFNFANSNQLEYQYSNCQGKKKALLIGINYFNSSSRLNGCINDVKQMSFFLVERWGYKWENIVILTDDQTDPNRLPTRYNIINSMIWLTDYANSNDSLFFHFSGHGTMLPNSNKYNSHAYDNAILPVDHKLYGYINDEEMHDIMIKRLPTGCRLTAIFDSCHSGTALSLPFVYSTKGLIKEPSICKSTASGLLDTFINYSTGNIYNAFSSITKTFKDAIHYSCIDQDHVINMKMSSADVISLSGCKNDEQSVDSVQMGVSCGALSWAFIKVLNDFPYLSYLSLLRNIRILISEKYDQKPQLSSSHPQDMNLPFII